MDFRASLIAVGRIMLVRATVALDSCGRTFPGDSELPKTTSASKSVKRPRNRALALLAVRKETHRAGGFSVFLLKMAKPACRRSLPPPRPVRAGGGSDFEMEDCRLY